MTTALDCFQSDIYVRYQLLAELLKGYRNPSYKDAIPVLDIGSGEEPITQMFLGPHFAVSGCDTSVHAINSPVQALTGDDLPYEDSSFPIVIAMDVLEHVEKQQREHFLSEMCRVSSELVILAFPEDSTLNQHYECYLQQVMERLSGSSNQFLSEHAEFGLPCAEWVEESLYALGHHTLSFGSFPTSKWFTQTVLDFCYNVTLPDEQKAFNLELNTNAVSLIADKDFYRSFVVASTKRKLLDQISKKIEGCGSARLESEIESLAISKQLLSNFYLKILSAVSDDSSTSNYLSDLRLSCRNKLIPNNDFLLGTIFESAVSSDCSTEELQQFSACSDQARIANVTKMKNSAAELARFQAAENDKSLRERILNAAKESTRVKEESEALTQSLHKKMDENAALSSEVHGLNETLDSLQRNKTTLESDLQTLGRESNAVNIENQELKAKLNEVKTKFELSQSHNENINQKLRALTMEIELRNLTILDLKQSLSWRMTKVLRSIYGAIKKPSKKNNGKSELS